MSFDNVTAEQLLNLRVHCYAAAVLLVPFRAELLMSNAWARSWS